MTNLVNGKERFKEIMADRKTHSLDILVNYFKSSGFYKICNDIDVVDKVRILVGLNFSDSAKPDFVTKKDAATQYAKEVDTELEFSSDDLNVELGIRKFLEYVKSGKIEIRVYPEDTVNARVYIMKTKAKPDSIAIFGSSNFTDEVTDDLLEFNVELENDIEVQNKFNLIWNKSLDVTKIYIERAEVSWIRDDITPYDLYLKCIYEYFKEEINLDKLDRKSLGLPSDFMKLQYQLHAVVRAEKILNTYNGVFISDVVGLGKTYICAMLAKRLRGRKLILCPPVLKKNWEEVLWKFDVPAKIVSIGKLDQVLQMDTNAYDYVFVDEAHRFRNSSTETYEKLHTICYNKKVVLVSATPINNKIDDVASLIYLFQNRHNSNIIPNQKNLEMFFYRLNSRLNRFEKGSKEYAEESKIVSEELRNKVLNQIMVRRTRTEIQKYYSKDLKEQGLTFPNLNTPERIVYWYNGYIKDKFDKTLDIIQNFKYTRYTPFDYLLDVPVEMNNMVNMQHSLKAFIKNTMLKRLESSFYAFNKSISRLIKSHERFVKMYESGAVYISGKHNVYNYIDDDDFDKLDFLISSGEGYKFSSSDFNEEFIEDLTADLDMLNQLKELWSDLAEYNGDDPKLHQCITELKNNPLINKSKVLIFTESKETARYIHLNLEKYLGEKVLVFTGDSSERLKSTIQKNFNPDEPKSEQCDDYRILVTTDVLSEGISLHRSNVVINYDLPWNPTKVMQRVGRVNRVGTAHSDIYVFNFFPCDELQEHLSLEENIISKIQAFHNILGEDSRYLSEYEEVDNYGIFGEQLYRKLNAEDMLKEDDFDEDSDLKYLKLIRDLRDEDSKKFEKIKNYSPKIRSAKSANIRGTLTFFRIGNTKKFLLSNPYDSREVGFTEAMDYFESTIYDRALPISSEFYDNLDKSKIKLFEIMSNEGKVSGVRKGTSNVKTILNALRILRDDRRFTDYDVKRIDILLKLFSDGVIPENTASMICRGNTRISDEIELFNFIWDSVPNRYKDGVVCDSAKPEAMKEIILSLDLIRGDYSGTSNV